MYITIELQKYNFTPNNSLTALFAGIGTSAIIPLVEVMMAALIQQKKHGL